MSKVMAAYSCAQRGVWGPYHVLIPGPGGLEVTNPSTGRILRHEQRDRSQDKTLCGIQLTNMWERDTGVDPSRIQCKRCRKMMEDRGMVSKNEVLNSSLLTKELRNKIPPICTNENTEDPTVVCKFFQASGSWTWYVLEGSAIVPKSDGTAEVPLDSERAEEAIDVEFFGLVFGFEDELGYFRLSELESASGPFGLGIERDKYFTPKPLSELWDKFPFKRR